MNTREEILVADVNVIIHLEKANLLNELIDDKRIRMVDLVMYQEYEYKENLASKKVRNIKKVTLSSDEMKEAFALHQLNPRNTIFDYYCYIVCKNNDYTLLTGDAEVKKDGRKKY